MRIGIGNDHSAVEMKNEVVEFLQSLGHEVVNYGTDSNASCNYPEFGEKVAKAVVAEVPQNSINFFTKYGFWAVDFGENEVGKNVYYATYRVK